MGFISFCSTRTRYLDFRSSCFRLCVSWIHSSFLCLHFIQGCELLAYTHFYIDILVSLIYWIGGRGKERFCSVSPGFTDNRVSWEKRLGHLSVARGIIWGGLPLSPREVQKLVYFSLYQRGKTLVVLSEWVSGDRQWFVNDYCWKSSGPRGDKVTCEKGCQSVTTILSLFPRVGLSKLRKNRNLLSKVLGTGDQH